VRAPLYLCLADLRSKCAPRCSIIINRGSLLAGAKSVFWEIWVGQNPRQWSAA
jgi:hypothetical protein